jgi:uncharacterized membrane protein YhaH (DUF805 family)
MILLVIAVAFCILCPFEPGFTFFLRRLRDQVPLEPLLLSWFPLLMAAIATALVIAVNSIMQAVCQKDSLSRNDKFPSRSEQ